MCPNLRRRRAAVRTGPLFVAASLLVAACGSSRRVVEFSDYVPLQDRSVGTDHILPGSPKFTELLGRGWEPLATHQVAANGRIIDNEWATFRFYVAVPGPAVLEIEGAAPAAPAQAGSLVLRVNERRAGRAQLAPGWRTYTIPLPADAIQIGWNRGELRVSRDGGDETADTGPRPVTAQIRRLRVRTEFDRPVWTDRPSAIRVTAGESGPARIEMPADSVMDVYAEFGADARLVGSVEAVPTRGGAREATLNAAVDLLDADGRTHTLFERAYGTAGPASDRIRIDLERWKDSAVRFRLRAWGAANGIVRWQGVGVEMPGRDPSTRLSGQLVTPPRSGRLGRPHVVIVLVDSGRADAFDGSRSDRPTPNVEKLAAGGTRFISAWSASGWTGESVPGIATGRYPEATGADNWGSRIPESVPTMAELLSKAGYYTFLWSQHSIWEGNQSFRRGFEKLGQARGDRNRMPAASDLFVAGRPTFAFVHLLPPHVPYTPPPPFRGSLTAGYKDIVGDPTEDLSSTWHGKKPSATEIAYMRARYDENVRYADHLVGRLLDTIRGAGQYDDTMIVFLADHGEAFYEHGRFYHSALMYEENVHVPLIVKWPARAARFAKVVADPVSLVDVVPTLVDGLRLGPAEAVFQGRSLIPLAFDSAAQFDHIFASRRPLDDADAEVYALRSGRYKVIRNEQEDTIELYDLAADAAEHENLAAKEPLRTRLLLQHLLLQRHHNRIALARAGGKRRDAIDADTMRALRALGYLQ
jgi:arylsulfatase A-like enzyme